MIDGVTNTIESWNPDAAKGKSVLGKDDFMKLMLQQLKYQDPLNPMDNSQFSAQLAQFSSLEQLANINKALENSINANYVLTQSVNNTMTANLIGKEAKFGGNSLVNNGQISAIIGYTLPAEAREVSIKIYDQNGKLVKTISGTDNKSGDRKVEWDFTDDEGKKLPEGNYTFKVEGTNFKGEEMSITSYKWGKIDSVKFSEEGTKIISNNVEYIISDILEISGGNN